MPLFLFCGVVVACVYAGCGKNPSDPGSGSRQLPENFKIAFIGDQGDGANGRAVLTLIKNEGAALVMHQGDFDYNDDPAAWDAQINEPRRSKMEWNERLSTVFEKPAESSGDRLGG
jgi:hypothetical protein